MAKVPSIAELETAAEWLSAYDDDGSDNRAHCEAVAAWLLERAKALAEAEEIRAFAKERGVPVARVRKALKATRQARAEAN